MKKNKPFLIIAVLSLIVHLIFFGRPSETVFDEVHFGKFITGYFTHEYFFDIHPPLGKLIISAAGYLTGFKPGFSFSEIGQKFPDKEYLWLRLLPNMAGALLPIIIYLLALRLDFSKKAAFAAGFLMVFENSILSQSRLILLDSFLWLFGFSCLLSYFKFKQRDKLPYLYLAGALGILSLSVKWTGVTFLASIIILEIIELFKDRKARTFGKLKPKLLALIIVPFLIYFAIFAVHLGLLTKSGPGDAFMTPKFQKTLAGNPNAANDLLKPANLFQKFAELNLEMYQANANLTAGHPYSSKWYTWPFMARPIYYWHRAEAMTNNQSTINSQSANSASRIYFLGNPVIWWISTITLFYILIMSLGNVFKLNREYWDYGGLVIYFLLGSYLFNLLPFLGIKRAMFLYHYTAAMIFGILILCYLIDKLKERKKIFSILIIASFVSFIYFAPLTYGLPLSERAYNLRVWFASWQ